MSEATTQTSQPPEYPAGLVQWAAHRGGGVRKFFVDGTGRPCGDVIDTPLLARVREWVGSLASQRDSSRVLLLVGGPGNGKSEAVEFLIHQLDGALGHSGELIAEFGRKARAGDGGLPPRKVTINLRTPTTSGVKTVTVVQDASVADPGYPGIPKEQLLIDDLAAAISATGVAYVACVNRGVLDEASIAVGDKGSQHDRDLLASVIRSVSQDPHALPCWPLKGYPAVCVWPMDVETLVATPRQDAPSPADQIFRRAIEVSRWPAEGACAAGDNCPFCRSRVSLENVTTRESLLNILRWGELATGKRWSFRELFSLASCLLAGTQHGEEAPAELSPCEWAAKLAALSSRKATGSDAARLRAPFLLVASQYEHALFSSWRRLPPRWLRGAARELEMEGDPGLLGLHYFLSTPTGLSIPTTLVPLLAALGDALDPAMADPETRFVWKGREHSFAELDTRFSQSVGDGLARSRKMLGPLEVKLLEILAETDDLLSMPVARQRRPALARELQCLVRDFACRLVRRSIGVRMGLVRERKLLEDFEMVVSGDAGMLAAASRQVTSLVNKGEHFLVYLNTTFGEPVPSIPRQATLRMGKQRVRPAESARKGRPDPTVRFLSIGDDKSHLIPLTFELYRSVRELESGMLPASLPRPVVALLDATRARLGGAAVRNEELLEDAEIRIGTRNQAVTYQLKKFGVIGVEGQL